MKHILEDGRWLLAAYDDIREFFSINSIVGKKITEIRPFCLDYMIQSIADVDDFENERAESAIDTDGRICLVFEDETNLEIEYSGDGPLLLGYNTAELSLYPVNDGSCYTLQTLFRHCIGRRITEIHFEESDNRMLFPAYKGIDMSEDDNGVNEIRFTLCDGTTLVAYGSMDWFSFAHIKKNGEPACVKHTELIKELNEETYMRYFGKCVKENCPF